MVRLALASASLLSSPAAEVIRLAAKLGLEGIEWAGDPHVPEGDTKTATEILMETLQAGLTVAAYAPLYRVTPRGESGIYFPSVLATAQALSAPLIRIYVGTGPQLSPIDRKVLINKLRHLGDLAGERGITLALSLGKRTCLETYDAALGLLRDLDHPFLRFAWESLANVPAEEASRRLREAVELVVIVLARRADREGRCLSLADEEAAWKERIAAYAAKPGDPTMGRFAVIGRLGSCPEELLQEEASFLRGLISAPAGS